MLRRGVGLGVALAATLAWAHKANDSYLTLTARGAEVGARWDIALRDLELGLDGGMPPQTGPGPELTARALSHLKLEQAGVACARGPAGVELTRLSDGVYARLGFAFSCPAPVREVTLEYSLLFDADPQHRGLVRLRGAGDSWLAFSSEERRRPLAFAEVTAGQQAWVAFSEGVKHIAAGTDHLCFLFALLLPSVLRRREGRWESVERLKPSLIEVVKVVTSFTIAHSITLGLAAFAVLRPDPKWVEVSIAASVGLAALNNLTPVLHEGRWTLAFGLGLLHGFGFVTALEDLGGGSRMWLSVLTFNLGVEAGQAVVVALFVPVAFLLRRTRLYRVGVLQLGSVGILAAAVWWLSERL